MTEEEFREAEVKEAMWAGDTDRLQELAPCQCCCSEHTCREACRAWVWGGCRGYGTKDPHTEAVAWAKHYGMTLDEFYGEVSQ